MKALIAGGGIGGIAAGLFLDRAGWDVTILEQAQEIGEVGAGLQISPNGVCLLEELGVMERLEHALFEPETVEMRIGATGQTLMSLPMKRVAQKRWGARYVQLYRPDLIDALRQTLAERQPDAFLTGAEVFTYKQNGGAVTVTLRDGREFQGDMLIGADGIHSNIREEILGPEKARFTGNVAWRGVVEADKLGDLVPPPAGCIWAGDGKHAVTTRMRQGRLVNFVGIVEQDDWREESWRAEGSKAEALRDFGNWNPVLTKIIEETPAMFRWALFGRAPLPRWSSGHVALLGDAAHPMLPSLAQGAVQALEDGAVLARELGTGSIEEALERYFNARIARVTKVQRQSAANLRLFHQRGAIAKTLRYGPIWMAGRIAPRAALAQYDWLYAPRP